MKKFIKGLLLTALVRGSILVARYPNEVPHLLSHIGSSLTQFTNDALDDNFRVKPATRTTSNDDSL